MVTFCITSLVKTPMFLIKDLQAATKINNRFERKGVTFDNVIAHGIITRCESVYLEAENSEVFIYTIDDGTSTINCLAQSTRKKPGPGDSRGGEPVDLERFKSEAAANPKNSLSQMTYLTGVALDRAKRRTDLQNLRLGDDVRVVGILEEHINLKHISIKEIEKVSLLKKRIDNLKDVINFYPFLQ